MKIRKTLITTLAMALMLTMIPISSVSAASKKVKAPAKVSISSVKQVNTKATVKWKKLKKTPSGYAVYVRKNGGKWKLAKKTGKKTTKATITVSTTQNNSFKVRAFKKYKVKKKTKVKYGKYSYTLTIKALKKKNPSTEKPGTKPPENPSKPSNPGTDSGDQNKPSTPTTPPASNQPELVEHVSGSIDKDMLVTITWSAAKNATQYEVYRASGSSAYTKVGTTSALQFTDRKYDPRASVSYKIRGINGSEMGEMTSALTLNPQNMTVKKTKTKILPVIFCGTCNADITELIEDEAKKEELHGTTYYCSECGINTVASHDASAIEKHIKAAHSEDDEAEVEKMTGVRNNITGEKRTITTTETHKHSWVQTSSGYKCSGCDMVIE